MRGIYSTFKYTRSIFVTFRESLGLDRVGKHNASHDTLVSAK